jgi:phosphoglycolate phosphatase-like HAD superfamily hydrolase
MKMKRRIAFDLDETLGVPQIADQTIVGFHLRPGCTGLLERLRPEFTLCLWTVSQRRYLDQILSFGLADYFKETYSWDERPCVWKDVRKLQLEYLIDDSPEYREMARKYGLADRYIVIPAVGSREDTADPLLWARLIEHILWPTG